MLRPFRLVIFSKALLRRGSSLPPPPHTRKMSQDTETDNEFSDGGFSGFTEDDFQKIDELHKSNRVQQPLTRSASPSVDEFSDGGFEGLTEDDFVRLEASNASSSKHPSNSLPLVEVEYDLESLPKLKAPEKSPYQRFRKERNLGLSVTDLISLSWCEMKFEYGLYGQSWRKIEHRPASFKTKKGKNIVVKQEIAVNQDRVQKKGTTIHKALERELKPVEIIVKAKTKEERWGLRLLNMISAVESLILEGRTREMPVFGLIEGCSITGIIDEIVREEAPLATKRARSPAQTPRKFKRSREDLSQDSQSPTADFAIANDISTITDEAESSSVVHHHSPAKQRKYHILKLIDTKSRKSNSLPRDDDALPSRLQLMLYHKLLSALLDTQHPFDFASFWAVTSVDPTRSFSESFLEDTQDLIREKKDYGFACLNDLSTIWQEKAEGLDVPGVHRTLQVIYRQQGTAPTTLGDAPDLLPNSTPSSAIILARSNSADHLVMEQMALLAHWNRLLSDKNATIDVTAFTAPAVGSTRNDVIGTREFSMKGAFLDEYLKNVMDWWHGRRKAVGVSLDHVNRCRTCEYCEGCEWREEKDLEARENIRKQS